MLEPYIAILGLIQSLQNAHEIRRLFKAKNLLKEKGGTSEEKSTASRYL